MGPLINGRDESPDEVGAAARIGVAAGRGLGLHQPGAARNPPAHHSGHPAAHRRAHDPVHAIPVGACGNAVDQRQVPQTHWRELILRTEPNDPWSAAAGREPGRGHRVVLEKQGVILRLPRIYWEQAIISHDLVCWPGIEAFLAR
jgi:hypothetical protein